MAQVVDALIIELALDAKDLQRQAREALDEIKKLKVGSENFGKDVESQGKKVSNFYSNIKRDALEVMGLFVGGRGVKDMVENVTRLGTSLGYASQRLNINAVDLAGWGGAIQRVGGQIDDAQQSFLALQQQVGVYQNTGQLPPSLAMLSSRVGDIRGLIDAGKYGEIYMKTAEYLAQSHMNVAQKSAFLQQTLPGLSSGFTTLLMTKTPAQINELVRASREALGVDDDLVKKTIAWNQSLVLLGQHLTGAANAAAKWYLPMLSAVSDKMQEIIDKHPLLGQAINAASGVFGSTAGGVLGTIVGWDIVKSVARKGGSLIGRGAGGLLGAIGLDGLTAAAAVYGLYKAVEPTPANAGEDDLTARLRRQHDAGGGGGLNPNAMNFLSGLSYLETSQRGGHGPAGTTAEGYFQFNDPTMKDIRKAGLPDPRFGSWMQQATATWAFIQKFHPDAASAIERGDFDAAARILRGRWPSLPGGAQQQGSQRMGVWHKELMGGGPRPPLGAPASTLLGATTNMKTSQVHSSTTVGQVYINAPGADSSEIARNVQRQIERVKMAGMINSSLTG